MENQEKIGRFLEELLSLDLLELIIIPLHTGSHLYAHIFLNCILKSLAEDNSNYCTLEIITREMIKVHKEKTLCTSSE